MSIGKVIELIGSSPTSWEDAANNAIKKASETIRKIRGIDVKGQTAIVKDGKIVEYRIVLHLSFEVE